MAASKNAGDSPLAYTTSQLCDYDFAAVEARWDQEREKIKPCQCKPKCYTACTKHNNICLGFEPKIMQSMSIKRLFRDRKTHPAWRADIIISARNVPRLMRRGFFWSPWNNFNLRQKIVLDSKDIRKMIGRSIAPTWGWTLEKEWKHRRHYHIKDDGPDLEWEGTLSVYATKPSTVINFDLGAITMDTTVWAAAFDWNRNIVYDTRRGPQESYNLVYPGMPLKGWWPWPKAPETESKEADVE